jgi:hypothetical protein
VRLTLLTPFWLAIVPSDLTTAHALAALDPAGPVGPRAPAAPAGPGGPTGPRGPAGIWPLAKSMRSSEWFFTLPVVTAFAAIFEFVTALFLSWAVPTLFRASVTAAALVPASETSSAMQAITVAGDSRRWNLRIASSHRFEVHTQ